MKKFLMIILIISLTVQPIIYSACGGLNMKTTIYDLKTEDLIEPIGIDENKPEFSWKMKSSAVGQKQTAYRIKVYSGKNLIWDSNKIMSDTSVNVTYGGDELLPSTLYNWTVTVWDKDGKKKKRQHDHPRRPGIGDPKKHAEENIHRQCIDKPRNMGSEDR